MCKKNSRFFPGYCTIGISDLDLSQLARNLIGAILSLRLRLISEALVVAETFDRLTTAAGLWLFPQIAEANPMLVT